jgi:putative protease
MADQEVGKVIHYYDKAMVAVVRLSGKLAVGEKIKIVKGENDFTMEIASMQIDHKPVEKGKKGDELAIKLESPTKEGATIFRVAE